jgi:hypothetical protein
VNLLRNQVEWNIAKTPWTNEGKGEPD